MRNYHTLLSALGMGTKSLPLSSNMAACRQFTSKALERVGDNDAGVIPDADICLASGKR